MASSKENLETAERPIRSASPSIKATADNALSSGSTLLNLAATDSEDCCFVKGHYYYIVGDSTSGKTWLSMSCFAEAAIHPLFKDYRLIFDDVENGALMDISYFFGKKVAAKIEPPARKNKKPVFSETVEDFYFNITDAIEDGTPFIYVLDSQDALVSAASMKKFQEHKKAAQEDKSAPGSYGDGKAKYHSENIRHVLQGLRDTQSILIILGQTRDEISGMSFATKTRSGGRALRFYATLELWSAVSRKLVKTVRGKPRTIGVVSNVETKKNRLIGKASRDRQVEIPIFYSMGIDDVGSCVDYLVDESHWAKDKQSIVAEEFRIKATREKLISLIEEQGKEAELRKIVGTVWRTISKEAEPARKKRYE